MNKKPNILFVFADQLRASALEHGAEDVLTPNLDAFANYAANLPHGN